MNYSLTAGILVIALLWLIASSVMLVTYTLGQPNLSGFGQIAGLIFILGLIIYLGRTQPNAADLPDIQPIVFPRLSYGKTLLLILTALVFLFLAGIILHPALVLIAALTIIAVWVIITRRQLLSLRLVMLGLLAGGLCFLLSGFSGRLDGFQGFYLACVPILFVAGGLLNQMTGLTHIYSAEGNRGLALKGFLWACVLALPVALLNVSGGSHAADAWVDQLWEPWAALVPGIAEETWARLFMTT
jgi:hypothetical protein